MDDERQQNFRLGTLTVSGLMRLIGHRILSVD